MVVPLERVVAFGLSARLVGVVRADHRSRRDKELERRVAFEQGPFQPGELLGAPQRLVRTGRRHVRAAVVASLSQPDLQARQLGMSYAAVVRK